MLGHSEVVKLGRRVAERQRVGERLGEPDVLNDALIVRLLHVVAVTESEDDVDTELLSDKVPLRDCVLHAELVAVAHRDSVELGVLDAVTEGVMVPLSHWVTVGEADTDELPDVDTLTVLVPVEQTERVLLPERLLLSVELKLSLEVAVRHKVGEEVDDMLEERLLLCVPVWHPESEMVGLDEVEAL